ncbi:hypothetical protein COCNU_16G006360 [Cocos nucifera]|uniref:Uncharacterized protein n=1 Tax=Cocos nucifera TaxID=13894 RepID=A0A8K0NEF7_COCNU|nr:hypothetical protein COCNU_16G006360 [Cocos nucifera]
MGFFSDLGAEDDISFDFSPSLFLIKESLKLATSTLCRLMNRMYQKPKQIPFAKTFVPFPPQWTKRCDFVKAKEKGKGAPASNSKYYKVGITDYCSSSLSGDDGKGKPDFFGPST